MLVVAALLLAGPAPRSDGASGLCARFGAGVVSGQVQNARLKEISGLVASRVHPGVYWTHNDSGGTPAVFALRTDGTDLGGYGFVGAKATDWEDIAVGPKKGAAGSYIYAGDIGDNAAELPLGAGGTPRDKVTIYRVAEPNPLLPLPGGVITEVEHFDLVYPNGPEDAEAMFVDPVSGDLFIITKSPIGRSRIVSAPAASMVNGATITLNDFGVKQIVPVVNPSSTFPGTFVTGADISVDGSLILVRTYQAVMAFSRAAGQSVPEALKGASCNAPQTNETQGESVAIAADMSRYLTISEGVAQPINSFSISAAAPTPPTTTPSTTTTTSTSLVRRILARTGDEAGRVLVGAGLVLVTVLAVRRLRSGSRSSAG